MGCEKSSSASAMTTMAIVAVVAILCLSAVQVVQSQGDVPSCASNLVPCANYINATNPPASCCTPLKSAIDTQLSCLCSLFNQKDLLKSFQINVTQALSLPKRCKIPGATTNMCASSPTSAPTSSPGSSGSSSSGSSSTSTSISPPTGDKNAADSIAWSRVTSLLGFMAPVMVMMLHY